MRTLPRLVLNGSRRSNGKVDTDNSQNAATHSTTPAAAASKGRVSPTISGHENTSVSSRSTATCSEASPISFIRSPAFSAASVTATSASAPSETSGASTVASKETSNAAAKAVTVPWRSFSVVVSVLLAVLDESQHYRTHAKHRPSFLVLSFTYHKTSMAYLKSRTHNAVFPRCRISGVLTRLASNQLKINWLLLHQTQTSHLAPTQIPSTSTLMHSFCDQTIPIPLRHDTSPD